MAKSGVAYRKVGHHTPQGFKYSKHFQITKKLICSCVVEWYPTVTNRWLTGARLVSDRCQPFKTDRWPTGARLTNRQPTVGRLVRPLPTVNRPLAAWCRPSATFNRPPTDRWPTGARPLRTVNRLLTDWYPTDTNHWPSVDWWGGGDSETVCDFSSAAHFCHQQSETGYKTRIRSELSKGSTRRAPPARPWTARSPFLFSSTVIAVYLAHSSLVSCHAPRSRQYLNY